MVQIFIKNMRKIFYADQRTVCKVARLPWPMDKKKRFQEYTGQNRDIYVWYFCNDAYFLVKKFKINIFWKYWSKTVNAGIDFHIPKLDQKAGANVIDYEKCVYFIAEARTKHSDAEFQCEGKIASKCPALDCKSTLVSIHTDSQNKLVGDYVTSDPNDVSGKAYWFGLRRVSVVSNCCHILFLIPIFDKKWWPKYVNF